MDYRKRQASAVAGCKQGCITSKKAICTFPRTSTVFTPVMPAACSQKQSMLDERFTAAGVIRTAVTCLPVSGRGGGSGLCRHPM